MLYSFEQMLHIPCTAESIRIHACGLASRKGLHVTQFFNKKTSTYAGCIFNQKTLPDEQPSTAGGLAKDNEKV